MSFGAQIVILVIAGFGVILLVRGVRAYLRFRGKRLITCPENQKPAAVEVDALRAAGKATLSAPQLRLSECSRWPERAGCGEMCLKQIESSPEDCLVKRLVTKWYEGKNCSYCGKPIHEVEWMGHKPALATPDRKTVSWDSISPERLPEVFETHAPVCWTCHVDATLLREHPDVVTIRPAKWRG